MEPKARTTVDGRSVEVWEAFLDPSVEDLDPQAIGRFAGGQMEIQNQVEKYLYRGQIKTIKLVIGEHDTSLEVEFDWVVTADFNGYLPTSDWRLDEGRPYSTTLFCTKTSWLDQDREPEEQRLVFENVVTNELIVLFPPGYSDFHPECVK